MSEIKKTAGKCEYCNQEMQTAESCTYDGIQIGGKLYERDGYIEGLEEGEKCGDCGIVVAPGNNHHFGCDQENCPKCGGQLISCGCDVQSLVKIKKASLERKLGLTKVAAKCEDCGLEMNDANSCTYGSIKIDGEVYKRDTDYYDVNERCHDCNIVNGNGNIHHFGCDIERCPKCGGQIISCGCDKQELLKSRNASLEKVADNPVSDHLPGDIDDLLHDTAQIFGGFSYTNIWKFRPKSKDVYDELRKLNVEIIEIADEVGYPEYENDKRAQDLASKIADIVMKYQVERVAQSVEKFLQKKGLEPESVYIKDNDKGIVESLSGNEALLVDIPLSKFGKLEFETLNQDEYKPGRKITSPIEATFTNGEYHITDGANRFTQAVANGDKTIPVVLEIEEGGEYLSGDALVSFYKKISGAMESSLMKKADELPYIEPADEFATMVIDVAMEKYPELRKKQEEIAFSWENVGSDDWYFLFDRPAAEQRDYLPLSGTIKLLIIEEVVGTLTFDIEENPEYSARGSYEPAVLPENVKYIPEGVKASLQKQSKVDEDLRKWVEMDKDTSVIDTKEKDNWYQGTLDKLEDRYELTDDEGNLGEQLAEILRKQIADEEPEGKKKTDEMDDVVSRLNILMSEIQDGPDYEPSELEEGWHSYERVPGLDKIREEFKVWIDVKDGWVSRSRYITLSQAEEILKRLDEGIEASLQKKATGEADQDYDHEVFDKIVEQIKAAGFEASHKEFDKYQGVYINVKGVDTFWITDVFFTGTMREEDSAKPYRSVKLTDQEGNPVSWSRGDYFQSPDDTVLEGYTLEMFDVKNDEKVIFDSPRIKDLPDITEVMTSFQYEPKTEMMHMVFNREDEPEQEIEVVVSDGKVDASYLVDYIKEVAEKKQTKKGANMNYLIRYFDSGEWFEKEEKFETKEAAEKIANDMYVCGVSANIKIADSDGNTVASLGEFADKIALCASCREILENYKGTEDLVRAWHSVDELSHRKVIEAGLEEKVSNAIAEYNSGLIEVAAEDLKIVKEAIKEPITPLADALYHLTYWKDGKDLVKACSVMRENKMDTTDVELAGIRLGAGKMKETLTDIGVAIQDVKRVLSGFIEMEA